MNQVAEPEASAGKPAHDGRLHPRTWLRELREPGTLRTDLLAGLTGAVVVLPQGVAFATLAGMPPQYGLYTAMVPCIPAGKW